MQLARIVSVWKRPEDPNYRNTVARLPAYEGMSTSAKRALALMSRDESFSGNADPSILSLLDALISGNDRTDVLQLGTLIGFSTIFLAASLERVRAATGAGV